MKTYKISIYTSIIFLIISGLLHCLSFIVQQVPSNETEKQLLNLMQNYKLDMGAGFLRTTNQLLLCLSACFPLFCIFGGTLLYYLFKNNIPKPLMAGVLNIYLVFYGVLLMLVWIFAFLPPILCISFVFLSLIMSRIQLMKNETQKM